MEITVTQARPVLLPGRRKGSALVGTGVGLRLVPGVNFVPDEAWKHARDNPSVKIWLDAGILTVGKVKLPPEEFPTDPIVSDRDGDEPAGTPPPADLRALNHKDCKVRILETADRALLTQWADAENRKPILELLEKRLAELN